MFPAGIQLRGSLQGRSGPINTGATEAKLGNPTRSKLNNQQVPAEVREKGCNVTTARQKAREERQQAELEAAEVKISGGMDAVCGWTEVRQ